MTIVPREWERVPMTTTRRSFPLSAFHAVLLALGAGALLIGVVLLMRGQLLGLAALAFGAGCFARSFVDSRGDGRARRTRP